MGIFDFLKGNKNIDNFDGLNEIYYDNGKGSIKERFYNKEGWKEGLCQSWYKNGQLKLEENYKKARKDAVNYISKYHGSTKKYYENGQLNSDVNYKNDKYHGSTKEYYENGQLKLDVNYKNDKYHGNKKEYYKNGQLKLEVNYKDNKIEGVFKSFYNDGQLKYERNYKDGSIHGINKKWFENGKLEYEEKSKDNYQERITYDIDGNLVSKDAYKGQIKMILYEDGEYRIPGMILCEDGKYRIPVQYFIKSVNISEVEIKGEIYREVDKKKHPGRLINIKSLSRLKAEHKKSSGGRLGGLPFFKLFYSDEINIYEWYDDDGKKLDIKQILTELPSGPEMAGRGTYMSKGIPPSGIIIEHDIERINNYYIIKSRYDDHVSAFTGKINSKEYVDGLPLESDQRTLTVEEKELATTDSNDKSSIFLTTDLAPEVKLPGGIFGIDNIYDGELFLKANNGFIYHLPLLFKDTSSDLPFIAIAVQNLKEAQLVIDHIISKNHYTPKKEEETGGWQYLFKNKFFVIGYLSEHSCVRINMLHNLIEV